MNVIRKNKLTIGDTENMLLSLYEQAQDPNDPSAKEPKPPAQDQPKEPEVEPPTDDPAADEGDPAGGDPAAEMGDPAADDGGMGGGEMGGEVEEATAEKVGRMYELKRIHYRLVTIQNHLDTYTDEKLVRIKDYVGRSLELFKIVIDNYDKYEQQIDDIILQYYDFIANVYDNVKSTIKSIKD